MKNRINLTNDEKLAVSALGINNDHVNFNMSEGKIEDILQKEKSIKFNEELSVIADKFEDRKNTIEQLSEELGNNIGNIEIKPMLSRILIKPFKQNPFQRIKVENGIIVDTGGYVPEVGINPLTGKHEEEKEFIVTGCVIEVGPETKYLKEGDVVYYRRDTAVPVPFLKQGCVSLAENQVIAVVNEGLSERWKV